MTGVENCKLRLGGWREAVAAAAHDAARLLLLDGDAWDAGSQTEGRSEDD